MKMFILSDIKMIEVSDNPYYITHSSNPNICYNTVNPTDIKITLTREMVEGRIFRNNRGENVCFGLSKEAGKMIGISFDTIDILTEKLSYTEEKVRRLENKLLEYKNMNLRKRLKILFTKHIYKLIKKWRV